MCLVHKRIKNHLNRYLVIRHRVCTYKLILACRLECKLTVNSDSLAFPFARTVPLSISKSWNFAEELPQLITKIFIIHSLTGLINPASVPEPL